MATSPRCSPPCSTRLHAFIHILIISISNFCATISSKLYIFLKASLLVNIYSLKSKFVTILFSYDTLVAIPEQFHCLVLFFCRYTLRSTFLFSNLNGTD